MSRVRLGACTELQQTEKVENALTRLAGLELDEDEHGFVVRELGRCGLDDLQAQLEARRTKSAVQTTEASPLALLDYYEQQGNVSAAVQVAQQLLYAAPESNAMAKHNSSDTRTDLCACLQGAEGNW
ncbi:MAG: hypothetical protein U0936_02770 [Planctomycetaceae bacterium]